jgi:integrase
MLYTMLVMAYCVGLRVGEIVRLKVGDIDIADQTIEIRETKFFKSRRLPVTNTVRAALNDYLKARRMEGAPGDPSHHYSGRGGRRENIVTTRSAPCWSR